MWDTVLWISIFISLTWGGWALLTASGKTMHLRPKYFLSTKHIPDPWLGWKQQKATLEGHRKKEHADWQDEYNTLLRSTCTHSYAATGSSPKYFTCRNCGYLDPWVWCEGCTCGTRTSSTSTSTSTSTSPSPITEHILQYRSGNCVWHGVDWGNFNKYSDRSNKPFLKVLK